MQNQLKNRDELSYVLLEIVLFVHIEVIRDPNNEPRAQTFTI